MSRQIWITSDTHFNHANIIKYCDRPFENPAAMNEALIEKWNSRVKVNDIIYHLGDVYSGDKPGMINIMARLNGHKRLVLGNHDVMSDGILHKYFEKVMMWRIFKDEKLMLSHVPVHPDSLKEKYDLRNVHGHIHEKQVMLDGAPDPRYRCLCVEHTDYAPVAIEEAYDWVSLRKDANAVPNS